MRVLFDQGTPDPLRALLTTHIVSTTFELGWSKLQNGDLLNSAELGGYEVLGSTDQSLNYQQNLSARRIGIVVLLTTSWPRIRRAIPFVVSAVDTASPGSYTEVDIPYLES